PILYSGSAALSMEPEPLRISPADSWSSLLKEVYEASLHPREVPREAQIYEQNHEVQRGH
ncbi:MAG: hypothetical protein QXE79_06070, partial [Candidatus Bathyarchaeia archaeon]